MLLCTSATDIPPLPPCRPDPERDSGERALGEEGEYHHWENLRVSSRGGRSGGREREERADLDEEVVVCKGEGGDRKRGRVIRRFRRRYQGRQ